eukprot:SAG31_NODE_3881_length_3789_cov_2.824390_5_plen_78_part_00
MRQDCADETPRVDSSEAPLAKRNVFAEKAGVRRQARLEGQGAEPETEQARGTVPTKTPNRATAAAARLAAARAGEGQ